MASSPLKCSFVHGFTFAKSSGQIGRHCRRGTKIYPLNMVMLQFAMWNYQRVSCLIVCTHICIYGYWVIDFKVCIFIRVYIYICTYIVHVVLMHMLLFFYTYRYQHVFPHFYIRIHLCTEVYFSIWNVYKICLNSCKICIVYICANISYNIYIYICTCSYIYI